LKETRWGNERRIRESKYNDIYKNGASIGMPDYLLRRRERGSRKMIARWRCGKTRKKETDSRKQKRRKNAAYAEWKTDV